MKSLLGAIFNKSHGASCNTIKLILLNQSDTKKAFCISLFWTLSFKHYFLFPEHVLSIADDILNSHNVLCIWMEPVFFDRKIYRKIGCFEMLPRRYKERILA